MDGSKAVVRYMIDDVGAGQCLYLEQTWRETDMVEDSSWAAATTADDKPFQTGFNPYLAEQFKWIRRSNSDKKNASWLACLERRCERLRLGLGDCPCFEDSKQLPWGTAHCPRLLWHLDELETKSKTKLHHSRAADGVRYFAKIAYIL